MLIVMEHNAAEQDVKAVVAQIEAQGYKAESIPGGDRVAIGVLGNTGYVDETPFRGMAGVREFIHVTKPYKLVSRDFHPEDTVVEVGGVKVGWNQPPVMIAGPCAIESREQLEAASKIVKEAGADILRGGAFKPRTGPHSFQGLGYEGVKLLCEMSKAVGMPSVTEVMRIDQLETVAEYSDCLQIGARNMQNFDLLKEAAKINKPILLKRGMSATLEEFLAAAEYLLAGGNPNVILCERGIRTFERALRNTLDLSVVPYLRKVTHLPVIVDPSHAIGVRDIIPHLVKASIVVGAAGVMVEVHPKPACALCDGPQSLNPDGFIKMMRELKVLRNALDMGEEG
ncbi:MAG: 3-deoxy-7-phosphoheptulonate synthase [Deltaproteobacteria bacterium]|nr:MAG: 3-deoxy-7-phosphoheptulonate synthase [Deltaproteobacteria bacterium]